MNYEATLHQALAIWRAQGSAALDAFILAAKKMRRDLYSWADIIWGDYLTMLGDSEYQEVSFIDELAQLLDSSEPLNGYVYVHRDFVAEMEPDKREYCQRLRGFLQDIVAQPSVYERGNDLTDLKSSFIQELAHLHISATWRERRIDDEIIQQVVEHCVGHMSVFGPAGTLYPATPYTAFPDAKGESDEDMRVICEWGLRALDAIFGKGMVQIAWVCTRTDLYAAIH